MISLPVFKAGYLSRSAQKKKKAAFSTDGYRYKVLSDAYNSFFQVKTLEIHGTTYS